MLSDAEGTTPFFGLYITQPKLQRPYRLTNASIGKEVVVAPNLNNVYQQVPFTVVLAQEKEGQVPKIELRTSLIKNNLSSFMYATDGGLNTKIELQVLLRSRESADKTKLICTKEASVELFVLEIVLREDLAAMQLGYQLPLNTAAVKETYNEINSPGLF